MALNICIYSFFHQISVSRKSKKNIYLAGFLKKVIAKIELSPPTVFSFKNYLQRSQHSRGIFGLILASAFGLFLSQKTAVFVRYVFKNPARLMLWLLRLPIHLFSLTYWRPQIYKFYFSEAFRFPLVKSELERRGGYFYTNSLRCTTMQRFWAG